MSRRNGWDSFRLLELPLHEAQVSHVSTCGACRPHWRLSATAIHEATHAAVALRLGIAVEFVAIDDWQTVEASTLEAVLYPILQPGTPIPALITRLDPRSLQRQVREVLVAMAAPSCVVTGYPHIDAYSAIEAKIATEYAALRKLDGDEILERAKSEVEAVEQEVLTIAAQLAAHGWVDAPTLDRRAGPS